MLNLIWNTIWSNPLLALPLVLIVPLLPLCLLCLTKTSISTGENSPSIWPVVGIGAGLYTIHKLNQVQKELRDLKETIKYKN
jgi:hypothetical protein